MDKAKSKGLSIVFFAVLIVCVGAGTLCGWLLSKQLTEEKLDDITEQIDDQGEELEFANNYMSRQPKSGSLAAAKARLKKLENEEKLPKGNIADQTEQIALNDIESQDFTEMEQSVSMLALFMEENGLHVSSLKRVKSKIKGLQFMEVEAQGRYSSILGAIKACMVIEGLIVKELFIKQVDDDGELTLKLTYTFNKSEDDVAE